MCGIIGTNISRHLIENGLNHMKRGNDGIRIKKIREIYLGFQRHRVVGGPHDGLQPFSNGKQALVFNGEVFNFEYLAKSMNLDASSRLSDSSVLFKFLCKHGIESLEKVNMMSAGAFLCFDNNEIILFRDWVGEMPLHYAIPQPGKWLFASTYQPIKEVTRLHTDDIKEVPPGARLHIPISGKKCVRLISPKKASDVTLEIETDKAIELLRQYLEKSADMRYWPHAPSAVMVSGGIDSTITLLLTLQRWKHKHKLPIYTFHCSDEPVTNKTDLYHALKVADYFNEHVEHRIISVSKHNIISAIEETIYALEDKRKKDFNIITALYNRFIAEGMAKDGIKVAYEGEGSDEALASYDPWGSYSVNSLTSGDVAFRQKMISNLHKGVLARTSKVMMHFGPVECRSYFLDKEVNSLLSHLPIGQVRLDGYRKGILIKAFSDVLPDFLLHRSKSRPQDASGISRIIRDSFGSLTIN